MPSRPRRTRQQMYEARLEDMSDNTLICHMATIEDSILTPLSEITDENGEPTFSFMKKVHDEYWTLARRHTTLAIRREDIMGYEMFAKALLMRREVIRRDYGYHFRPWTNEEMDPEDPRITMLYRVHRRGEYSTLDNAAQAILGRTSN